MRTRSMKGVMAGSILVLQLDLVVANVLNIVEHDQSGGLGIEGDAGRVWGRRHLQGDHFGGSLRGRCCELLRRRARGRNRSEGPCETASCGISFRGFKFGSTFARPGYTLFTASFEAGTETYTKARFDGIEMLRGAAGKDMGANGTARVPAHWSRFGRPPSLPSLSVSPDCCDNHARLGV